MDGWIGIGGKMCWRGQTPAQSLQHPPLAARTHACMHPTAPTHLCIEEVSVKGLDVQRLCGGLLQAVQAVHGSGSGSCCHGRGSMLPSRCNPATRVPAPAPSIWRQWQQQLPGLPALTQPPHPPTHPPTHLHQQPDAFIPHRVERVLDDFGLLNLQAAAAARRRDSEPGHLTMQQSQASVQRAAAADERAAQGRAAQASSAPSLGGAGPPV